MDIQEYPIFSALKELRVSFDEARKNNERTMFPQECFRPRLRNFSLREVPTEFELVKPPEYDSFFSSVNVEGRKKRVTKFVHPRNLHAAHLSDLVRLLEDKAFTDEQLSVGIVAPNTSCTQVEPIHIGFTGWVTHVPCVSLKESLELKWPIFSDIRAEYFLLVP